MALARLAAIDPGGKLGNRPAGSLRSVLLPWVPYTAASVEQRLNAFRQVRKKYPEIAWQLLLGLLPKHHDHSSPTSSPRFRDWKPDREGVTVAEWAASVEGLVGEASEMLCDEPARWLEIVDNLGGLPVHLRQRLIDELAATLQESVLNEEQRLKLWQSISQEVDHHREFPSAQWVMDDQSLESLEALASSLTPKDRIAQDAKLFDWRPRLPGVRRSDGEDYDRALEEAQRNAVTNVYAEGGLEGVRRLAAESPQSQFVGHSLAKAVQDEPTDELIAMLGLVGKDGDMAQGWLRQAVNLRGTVWARSLKEKVIALDPETQAAFLRQLPSGPDLKQLLDEVADTTTAAYWRSIHPLIFDDNETAFAVRHLIAHGRPAAAVELLAVRLHGDNKAADGVTVELVGDALRAVLSAEPDEARAYQGFAYSIGEVTDKLAALGAEDQEIAHLEWAFFPLLEHSSYPPKALYAALKRDPQFFVDLVALVYRGKDDQPRELDAAAAAQASNAWSVLHAWRDIPGSSDDGSIDRDHLHRWVRQVRLLLDERDRADIGDEVIGEVLSGSPTGQDGAWPAEPVRELLEDIVSRELETGLHIGKVNSRGVTSRGALDGGEQERAIAKGYQAWAEITGSQWPRTTRLLRGLSESYEHDARRLDAEADARGNRD